MRRPSFQMYPDIWLGNSKLRRCTHAEKGMWIDTICLLHDGDQYGILRWPLAELAHAIGAALEDIKSLVRKEILKGADVGETCAPYVYTPRHARKNGKPITLIEEQAGPVWFSSRMIVDEYNRIQREKSLHNDVIRPPKGSDGKTIWNSRMKMRAEIFKKTDGHCYHCGTSLDETWQMDHLVAKANGGKFTPDNLVPACASCNFNKADQENWQPVKVNGHAKGEANGAAKGEANGAAKGEANGAAKGEANGAAKVRHLSVDADADADADAGRLTRKIVSKR